MGEMNRKPVRRALTTAVAVLASLGGCALPQPNPGLTRLTIATKFGPNNVCSQGVLPAIDVKGAPAGTTRYRIRMSDLDVLYQRPWEQTIATGGGDIEEGAASPFPAPCVGEQQELAYRFEVMALDSTDRPLAYGQTTAVALSPMRTSASGGGPSPRLTFDRAAGVQGGPYVLRELTPAQSTSPRGRTTQDLLNSLGSRIVRPPPVLTAPVVE